MGTLPPRGAHLSGRGQLLLRITEKKSGIQDIDISPTKIWITLSCGWTFVTGQNWLERALFFCDHHSAMGHFLSAQMTETKLIRKLAPKHFFYVKN
jgi:hypothetical protein